MIVTAQFRVGMFVLVFRAFMDMQMIVFVNVLVAMDEITVRVGVAVVMPMAVAVLKRYGIFDDENRGGGHDDQGDKELERWFFMEEDHAEGDAEKRSDGVPGAGFGRPQILLSFDVAVDAQTVAYEPQQKNEEDPKGSGKGFPQDQRDDQTARSRETAFDNDDLRRAFIAQHPCAIVFEPPADCGGEDEERTVIELEALSALKAQKNAGEDHENDGDPQLSGYGFFKEDAGDDRRGGDL